MATVAPSPHRVRETTTRVLEELSPFREGAASFGMSEEQLYQKVLGYFPDGLSRGDFRGTLKQLLAAGTVHVHLSEVGEEEDFTLFMHSLHSIGMPLRGRPITMH